MAEIALRGATGAGLIVEVDDEDVELVAAHKWYALRVKGSKTIYARTRVGGKTIYLHRLVSGAHDTDEVDHVDGNGLNNRRGNLRPVTHRENLQAAALLPGRFGNPTLEELDRELEAFSAKHGYDR